MVDRITAPFTPDEIAQLWAHQASNEVHSYTCPHRENDDHRGDGDLVPTVNGWICPFCRYTQNWAQAALDASEDWDAIADDEA